MDTTVIKDEPLRGLPVPKKKSKRRVSDVEVLAAAVEQAGTEIRTGLEAIAKALEAQYEDPNEVSHEPH